MRLMKLKGQTIVDITYAPGGNIKILFASGAELAIVASQFTDSELYNGSFRLRLENLPEDPVNLLKSKEYVNNSGGNEG